METLRCQDPWGREVVLLDELWYGKILDDHPELAGALEAVERALADPELVNYDKAYENREVFYRPTLLPSPYGWLLVKVVVEYAGEEGEVVTVFVAYNVNPDKRFNWAR